MWDEFVRNSRNGTFLLQRGYMDYHADRFPDASLIISEHGKVRALLPACRLGDTFSTHAGLTYGGFILPPDHCDASFLLAALEQSIELLRSEGYREIIYKPVPYIFQQRPSQEDLYALWRCGFTLKSRLISSTIDLRRPWKFDMSKRQQTRKAQKTGITISESDDWQGFWLMLENCLKERHGAAPVHSLPEMLLLKERFPQNIRLFTAGCHGEIHAGVVIYDTGFTAHSQYAATTAFGRDNYMLTALYHELLTAIFAERNYFDFGTSNEQQGHVLNAGLLSQKFSMGGRGVAFDTYHLTL